MLDDYLAIELETDKWWLSQQVEGKIIYHGDTVPDITDRFPEGF